MVTIVEERETLRRAVRDAVAAGDAGAAVAGCRKLLKTADHSTDVFFCGSQLRKVADALQQMEGVRQLRMFVVRSVTVEPILPFLTTEALLAGYLLEVEVGGYGSYAEEMMDPGGALAVFKPDVLLVIFDLEDVAGRLADLCGDGVGAEVEAELAGCVQRISRLVESVRGFSNTRVVLQGFVVPETSSLGMVGDANFSNSLPNAVRRINAGLAEFCRGIADCVFFDVDQMAAKRGREQWRDTRLFLSSRLPVGAANFGVFARGLVRSMNVLFRAPRKVLCTDLDNTLWGGVLGEEGAEGIVTGSTYPGTPFLAYQRYLKQISSRGILLAIASKNDEAEVREAFRMRAADLAVELSDFSAYRINWNDKVQSLREMARELSLGLDAFVLVDDHPVECEAVRQQLPEVGLVQAPVDEPWRLPEMLAEESFFDVLRVTGDDRNRATEYKAQAQRAELELAAGGRDEFLASLGIVCTFVNAVDAPLARAVQLLAKTNQFNLTTRRRSAMEVEEFASDGAGQAVAVRVRDRFGDAGIVGLALARVEGETCRIDSFVLSCRVIGRGIETALLARVADRARSQGATRLLGEFVPTKKNGMCVDFYLRHGFAESADGGGTFYELDLRGSAPELPSWILVEGDKTADGSEAMPVASNEAWLTQMEQRR